MIANWIHIVLVHFVVIGTPWLVYRVTIHRNAPLDSKPWKHTFSALIVMTAITAVSYVTGPEAADYTKQVLVDFPQDHVENHALWGRIGFVIQALTGLLGIMGWASILQEELPHRKIPIVLTVLLIINTLVILYTAHLGGFIRRMDLMDLAIY